jgi:hypothetical protein
LTDIAGAFEFQGQTYVRGGRGEMIPIELVKTQDALRDELVRRLFAKAEELSKTLADFKAMAMAEIDQHQGDVIAYHGGKPAPADAKGNVTLKTIDGLQSVQIQVADVIRFESTNLKACELLVRECVADWMEGARAELRVIVLEAFTTDKAGNLSRGKLLGLLRYEISDDRWVRAMGALRDAIQVDGTKAYLRFHSRAEHNAPWRNLSLDLATA